jgi:hypothetical protein
MKLAVSLLMVLAPNVVLAEADLHLTMGLSNLTLIVTWSDAAAVLQRAPSVAGNWIIVSDATSPYTVPDTNSTAFYRLRADCISPSGIVSWWAADATASDLVGTNNGTLMGSGAYAQGEVHEAFSLDGVSGWVDIANSDSLNPTGPFSVECWIKASSSQFFPQVVVVDKSHGWTDGTGWAIQTTSSGQAAFFYGIGGPTGSSSYFPFVSTMNSILDDQWHHLAGLWTGTQLEIYEDGVLQQSISQTVPPANNSRDVEIGRSWGGGNPSRFFRGSIDEVAYFNRALSSKDVVAIFNAGAAGKCKPELPASGGEMRP